MTGIRNLKLISLWLFALVSTANAQEGFPVNARFIGQKSYTTVITTQVRNPIFIYGNIYGLVAADEEVPQEGLTPEFKKRYLEQNAFAVPVRGEPPSTYTDKKRVEFASYYGGPGLNGNLGDGRNSIKGKKGKKGTGPTDAVNPFSEPDHRSGTMGMEAAIVETRNGMLLDLELPFGAMGGITIMDVGTNEPDQGDVRVLQERVDFVRAAHYMLNEVSEKVGRGEIDRERVRAALLLLPDALPMPEGAPAFRNRGEQLRAGLFEMARRLGVQLGYKWAHSMEHGAVGSSNSVLTGEDADLTTFIYLDGYQRIKVLPDVEPHGSTKTEKDEILALLLKNLRELGPAEWQPYVPSDEQLGAHLDKHYVLSIKREMISMAGVFNEFADRLAAGPQGGRLGALLIKLAEAGNEEVIALPQWHSYFPYGTGTYNLPKIMEAMAAAELSVTAVEHALEPLIQNQILRTSLARAYVEVFTENERLAREQGITKASADRYRLEAAKLRNRKMDKLFRNDENLGRLRQAMAEYRSSKNPAVIENYINTVIKESRRNFKDAPAYSVVLQDNVNYGTGRGSRVVFDAKKGAERTVRVLSPQLLRWMESARRQRGAARTPVNCAAELVAK